MVDGGSLPASQISNQRLLVQTRYIRAKKEAATLVTHCSTDLTPIRVNDEVRLHQASERGRLQLRETEHMSEVTTQSWKVGYATHLFG